MARLYSSNITEKEIMPKIQEMREEYWNSPRYYESLPVRSTGYRSTVRDARDLGPDNLATGPDTFHRNMDLLPPAKRQRLGLSIREEESPPLITGAAGARCARCYKAGHLPSDCPLNRHCGYCRLTTHATADCPQTHKRSHK